MLMDPRLYVSHKPVKPKSVKQDVTPFVPEVVYYTDGSKILQDGIDSKWAVVKYTKVKPQVFRVLCRQ